MTEDTYASAGVNIDAGNDAVRLMRAAIRRTYTPAVLSDTGSFGGLFSLAGLHNYQHPVLVASTDGVGTKTKVAARLNRWETVGQDLVNHCINDILVQGATPLFFMDYVATSALIPTQIASIVNGMAQACAQSGVVLLGGETAEMPGVYVAGEVDIAGTIVGIVEHQHIIDGSTIQRGDMILQLPSTGLHTNGFSLARQVLDTLDWHETHPLLGESIGDALLAVHRSYLPEVRRVRDADIPIKGLAHITGGGIIENLPRILPAGTAAAVVRGRWNVPPIFALIQQTGNISDQEMQRVFNMGLGMLMVVAADVVEQVLTLLPEATQIGEITSGERSVYVA